MEKARKREVIFLLVRAALSLVLLLIGVTWVNEANYPLYANAIVMVSSYLIISYDVYVKAFREIFLEKNPFNECTLMILASIGAFALRAFGREYNEFMEGVLVILLYQVGEFFEDLAEDKSKEAITKAIDLREEKALVRVGERLVSKKAEEIEEGDLLLINAGGKILCDGLVEEGAGQVDESSLTGEFAPISKSIGDRVSSGTLLSSGHLAVRAEKAYCDSTVAKLLDLVENSAQKKSKATRFITKFAKYYTPIVMALALLVAVVPPLFLGISDGATWVSWIRTALVFLVVSCPCAVVISVPLAYFSGLGLASRSGILVKGAAYFDQLNELAHIAFDKTGTLTEGRFKVTFAHPEGIGEKLFNEYLSAAEHVSSHPIAACLKKLSPIDEDSLSAMEDVPGEGCFATYKGHRLFAGKMKEIESVEGEGTAVGLRVDGEYRGYCLLGDCLKENSASAIAKLNSLGLHTILLSGDKPEQAGKVASSIGIQTVKGGLKPEEKVAALSDLISKGDGRVAYVGDGINDAASIALSDVGVAMGGLGSDAAVENADCVILNDDPKQVVVLLKVARKTKNRATFNIAVSLIVKAAVMILSVIASATGAFVLPLWVGVLSDSGLALLMILSSLLLGFEKVRAD